EGIGGSTRERDGKNVSVSGAAARRSRRRGRAAGGAASVRGGGAAAASATGNQAPRCWYQWMIGVPTKTMVSVPAARNGPNGKCCLRERNRSAISAAPSTAP